MSFIAELKRRNVYRVAVMYLVAAWLIMQVAAVMFPALMLPEWLLTVAAILVIVGFPICLILAWVFELTPEGVKLEKDVSPEESITAATGRNIDFIIIGLLAAAVIFFGVTYDWSQFDEPTAEEPVPTVAVLAFADMSPNRDQEYFSDGLSDTLIHVLAQVSGLKVTAKTSSFFFKDKDLELREIARKLEVGNIVEGSVQKAGDRVRVTVQLVNAADGTQLWSKRFDRDLEDIFAVQDEIAQDVVKALEVTLLETEERRLAERYRPTLEAYGELILGQQAMAKRTAEDLAAAEQHFKAAIALDPAYALAYVGLADTYLLQEDYAGLLREQSLELRQPLIDKALQLDPLSGEAYTARAMLQREPQAAAEDFRRAIELNPNYATAHQWYSDFLLRQGQSQQALSQIRIAADLDPMAPIIQQNLAYKAWSAGYADEALTIARRSVERSPEFPGHYRAMAEFQARLGHLSEAQRWLAAGRQQNPEGPDIWWRLCRGFLYLGDPQSAERCWIELSNALPGKLASSYARAWLCDYRGEWDEALAIQQSILERVPPDLLLTTRLLADLLARQGETQRALDLMTERFPQYLETDVVLDANDLGSALTFAAILHASGETERRDVLLRAIEARIAGMHRIRGTGYAIFDVHIYAMRGDRDRAIASLREAIDLGWRVSSGQHNVFWWQLRDDWKLASLHQDPDFIALLNKLEEEVRRERELFEANKDKPLLRASL